MLLQPLAVRRAARSPHAPDRIVTFNIETCRAARSPTYAPADNRIGMYVFPDTAEARVARRTPRRRSGRHAAAARAGAARYRRRRWSLSQEVDNEAVLQLFRDVYLTLTLAPTHRGCRQAAAAGAARAGARSARRGASNLKSPTAEARAEIERGTIYGYAPVIEGNDKRGIDVGMRREAAVAHLVRCPLDLSRLRALAIPIWRA